MKSKLLQLILMFLSQLGPNLLGQEGTHVNLQIDFVAWGDSIENLTVKAGSKQVPIEALAFTYSKPLKYSGANVVEIYHSSSNTAASVDPSQETAISPQLIALRKQRPGLAAIATVPSSSQRVTILIAPAAGGTFQTYVIDDDPSKLPLGQLRVHNYSNELVALKCNEKPVGPLKTGQAALAIPVSGRIHYQLAYQKKEKWKIQEDNIMHVGPREQVQMVILKSDNQHFVSYDGTRSGYLQMAVLRRQLDPPAESSE